MEFKRLEEGYDCLYSFSNLHFMFGGQYSKIFSILILDNIARISKVQFYSYFFRVPYSSGKYIISSIPLVLFTIPQNKLCFFVEFLLVISWSVVMVVIMSVSQPCPFLRCMVFNSPNSAAKALGHYRGKNVLIS